MSQNIKEQHYLFFLAFKKANMITNNSFQRFAKHYLLCKPKKLGPVA